MPVLAQSSCGVNSAPTAHGLTWFIFSPISVLYFIYSPTVVGKRRAMPVRDILYKRLGLVPGQAGMQKKDVCRCLFGRPDHEELRKDLQIQLKESSDAVRELGFDTELDKPVKGGKYEWTIVEESEYVPDYYRKQYRPTRTRNIRATLEHRDTTPVMHSLETPPSSPETSTVLSRLEPEEVELDETMKQTNETTPEAKVTRQSTIGEFMKIRKRRRLEEDDDDQPDGKVARH